MSKSIPAGAGEKMQYLVHDFNDNTIRFVLHYPGQLQPEALRQATLQLVQSVDVLHSAFIPGRLGAHWQPCEVTAEDCFAFTAGAENALEAAVAAAMTGIDAAQPFKLRCSLFHGDGDSAVTLLISHLCVDGSDGRYLLGKLCEAYGLYLARGSCANLEVKRGSRSVEQVYAGLSPQERRRLMKDPRTGVKSVFPFPSQAPGEPVALRRMLPADTMAAAHARARADGATLNDVLLTACYHAYQQTTGKDRHAPVSVTSMMDLRRHLPGGDTQGLCNLTGGLLTALPEGLGATFAETLGMIADQTRRAKEDPLAGLYGMPLLHGAANRLPMGLLLAVAGRLYGSMAVGLTNIGRIPMEMLAMGGVTPTQGIFGGPLKKKPGVQISCASFGDGCTVSIWGHAAAEDLPCLEGLLDSVCAHVRGYARGG